jgi:hypothetical protein
VSENYRLKNIEAEGVGSVNAGDILTVDLSHIGVNLVYQF